MKPACVIVFYILTCAASIFEPVSAFIADFAVNPDRPIKQRSLSFSYEVGWVANYRNKKPYQISNSKSSKLTISAVTDAYTFIGTELRGAAMKLHTQVQAPKEGEAPAPKSPVDPDWKPTLEDYLNFLVDSKAVYEEFEDIVLGYPELSEFRDTGLERTDELEKDIQWMMKEYELERPEIGLAGLNYASDVKRKASESIPAFMCHYYNFYFAHTAGGRMIGKKMSSLLLDKKTLEFYKWEGNLNEIKSTVKGTFEKMAAKWSREEKDECINQTASAFRGGGGLNKYISSRSH